MHKLWKTKLDIAKQNNHPIIALAPMADVTDVAFREIIAQESLIGKKFGGPDIFWTEFVSANGLDSAGRNALMRDLEYTQNHRPIIAQIFSPNPAKMYNAAYLICELGFDGIDINMGCPDKAIEKQGAGASMIKTPDVAREVIHAVKNAVHDYALKAGTEPISVSVKTRIGYNAVQIDEWIPFLLATKIDALTVHLRTRKELSKVPANWDYIKKVLEYRDKISPETVIIGNGDVMDLSHAQELYNKYGVDGVMIGRAVFGNPWIFDWDRLVTKRPVRLPTFVYQILPPKWIKKLLGTARYTVSAVPQREKMQVLLQHAKLFNEKLGDIKSYSIMKKHFKAYCHGFTGAKELREKLMNTNNVSELEVVINEFLVK
jgi:tRNA-dihydrouridine synthase